MTRIAWVAAGLMLSCSVAVAQPTVHAEYASVASGVIATHRPASREHTPQAMAAAARVFLASLRAEQRERTALPLGHAERREWTNLPTSADAGGVRLGELEPKQIAALCDLMATLLSEQGYAKMVRIMLADDKLLDGGRRRQGIGTEEFSVVLFGEPTPDGPWAFQLDGHHVGVNLAIEGDRLTMSPSFIGTQPEAYHLADQRVRPLSGEVDGAYELVNSLSDAQRDRAILGAKRGRIKTGPGADGRVPTPEGVSCAEFDAHQKQLLMTLVGQWLNNLPPEQAERRLRRIEGEIPQTRFSWRGSTDPRSDISYTIQGPTLIIEYACQDLGGDPPDHLHTMYRDPTNEYGGQLRE